MRVAGHDVNDRQMVALHALYRGLLRGERVYGCHVGRQLKKLASRGIISKTGMGAYMIPWGSPGAAIIEATPDFVISEHLG